MFGLSSKKEDAPVMPALIEVRSRFGISQHVVETNGVEPTDPKASPAVCGNDSWIYTNTIIEVTAKTMEDSLPSQNLNWRWCSGCVEKVLPKQ